MLQGRPSTPRARNRWTRVFLPAAEEQLLEVLRDSVSPDRGRERGDGTVRVYADCSWCEMRG